MDDWPSSPTIRGTTFINKTMQEETPNQLNNRHREHKIRMEKQAERKEQARTRHRSGWHKRKIIPIQLV
jgi:hypothetical protein